jgi:hypothetical protein
MTHRPGPDNAVDRNRSRSGWTVRSRLATMYQLGFVRQAVPSAFSLNRFASGVGTGAACDAARARKRLRGLGIRRRVQVLDRPKLGWDSLTDAELQVARLAAAGCTNRGSPTGCSFRPTP